MTMIADKPTEEATPSTPRRWPYVVASALFAALSAVAFHYCDSAAGAYEWSVCLAIAAVIAGCLAVWPEIGTQTYYLLRKAIRCTYFKLGQPSTRIYSTARLSVGECTVMVIFVVLAIYWSYAVKPVDQVRFCLNPDEAPHYQTILWYSAEDSIPPYGQEYHQYYESIHPPLYHWLASRAYDIALVAAPGYSIQVTRLLNVVISLLTLLIISWMLRRYYSRLNRTLALALIAFIPGYVQTAGALSADNTGILAGAAMLATTLLCWKEGITWQRAAILGIVTGLSTLCKYGCLAFIPAAVVTLIAHRELLKGIVACMVAAAIGAWWYIRNVIEYGDLLRQNAELNVMTKDGFVFQHVSPCDYASHVIKTLFALLPGSFRGFFPAWVNISMVIIVVLAFTGSAAGMLRSHRLSNDWWIFAIPILGNIAILFNYVLYHYQPSFRLANAALAPAVITAAFGLQLYGKKLQYSAVSVMLVAAIWSGANMTVWHSDQMMDWYKIVTPYHASRHVPISESRVE